MVLRVAIGWHFLNEGLWKYESWQKGDKPFSAEPYLRASTGPLAPYFRGMVPDVNGLARLDPVRLKAGWLADADRIAAHYGFNDDQKKKAAAVVADSSQFADSWFLDRENREQRQKYYHDLGAVQKVERNANSLANEREWASAQRKTLDADRKSLTAELDARGASLREALIKLATPEQVASAGAYAPPWSTVDYNNRMTAFSLIAIGVCLIAGFFTRFAALGGAAFLALIYLCMPPWPGLPPNPLENGHFFIVDKNLVELVACLALAFLPTGHWVGLDALLFGSRRRARLRRLELEETEAGPARGEAGRRPQAVS